MAQIDTQTLVSQLVEKEVIKRPVFSLMLINNHEGILSLGGTTASAIEKIQRRANEALGQLGSNNDDKKLDKRRIGDVSRGMNWVDHWKWSHVQGADGWWQILMPGVWVEGRKVLKNQPVVLDVRPLHPKSSAISLTI